MFHLFRLDDPTMRSINGLMFDLPSPLKISYFWNFGSLLGLVLSFQLMTGMLLSMHFISDVNLAFSSVDFMNRDIGNGWLIRYFHMSGASIIFIFLYIHMGRGIYYSSFNLMKTWFTGIIMYILIMAISFLGYVLPWGQMSYWGATVITKLFSVMPIFGSNLVIWIWGGFAVDYPTLTRFFSLHYLLPLVLVVMMLLHLVFLHETGSKNPLGLKSNSDKINFFPLFAMKDIFGFFFFFFLVLIFFFFPNIFMDYQKFLEANSLVTLNHIQPEWYLLPPYAVLRAIPKKLGGVMGLFCFMVILFFLPLLKKKKLANNSWAHNSSFKFVFQIFFWAWVMNFFFLIWLGACPVEPPYLKISRVAALVYFVFYFLFMFF